MTVIDTPGGIAFFQLCSRRGALRLEMAGLRRRGRSAYSICKEVYGLKGSRQKILDTLNRMIQEEHARHREEIDDQVVQETLEEMVCPWCSASGEHPPQSSCENA